MIRNLKSKKQNYKEDLFGGNLNQYKARHLILHQLPQNLDGDGIGVDSKMSVHAIVVGFDDLMISVARQISLITHYPNYDDCFPEKNKTTITFLVPGITKLADLQNIEQRLHEKDALGNLADYCHFSIMTNENDKVERCEKSYIDVEFELVGVDACSLESCVESLISRKNKLSSVFIYEKDFDENFIEKLKAKVQNVVKIKDIQCDDFVDTRRARMINQVYSEGCSFRNFISRDFEDIKQYLLSLDTFVYHSTEKKRNEYWNALCLEEKLSNVSCGDLFETRQRSKCGCDYTKTKGLLTAMSKSEHSRWCVDKLLFGFRPLTSIESYEYENKLSDEEKDEYKKLLKKDEKAHLNICDYRTLYRSDPVTIKYDCFMILASDTIAKETPV